MKLQIDHLPLSLGGMRPTQGRTLAVMQVSGGSQSFNAVNTLRLLGRWMRMITIPNQSSVAKAFQEFDEAGRRAHPRQDRPVDGAAGQGERVARTARVVHESLKRDFAIARPRLAMAALNPHAGEGGAVGLQEIATLIPVAQQLRGEGIDITDPRPADTLFHDEARATYDAAICMYHDQALIPVKTLDFWGGVNVSLGLPIIRTSPDHGTGFDIAGRGLARPDSLIAAIRLASEMAAARAAR